MLLAFVDKKIHLFVEYDYKHLYLVHAKKLAYHLHCLRKVNYESI